MNRKMFRAGIAAGICCAALALSASFAMAAGYPEDRQAEGTQTTFDKYLVMPENSPVPAASFSYTITGTGNAEANDEGGNAVQIFDGVMTDSAPSITWDASAQGSPETVQFLPSDQTKTYADADDEQKKMAEGLKEGEKFAVHTATVSFSGIRYPEPGIYRYKITEQASAQGGITDDPDPVRLLDVYVVDDGTGKLNVSSTILHAPDDGASEDSGDGSDGSRTDFKSQGYTNRYESYCLEISKAVSGNQASHDKYFKFHVRVEKAAEGTVYDVSLYDDRNEATRDGNAEASPAENEATVYTDMTNPSSMTEEGGTAEADFYLQHGQKIVIRGIAPGSDYTVTEEAEDYQPSFRIDDADDTEEGSTASVENASSDCVLAFTNSRSGLIPTGVIISILPYGALAAAAAAGIVFFRRRREED